MLTDFGKRQKLQQEEIQVLTPLRRLERLYRKKKQNGLKFLSSLVLFFLCASIIRTLPAFDTVEYRWSIYQTIPDACFEKPWGYWIEDTLIDDGWEKATKKSPHIPVELQFNAA